MHVLDFEIWLKRQLEKGIPEEAVAINFNLYENSDDENKFDVQIVACPTFDEYDEDWACDEVFSSGEDLFSFNSDSWETAEEDFKKLLEGYLKSSTSNLSEYEHIAFGFVDGDLYILS